MNETLVVRRETHIAAPCATVFAFLTDPEKILSWMGAEATTEAHPGGLYLVRGIYGRSARGAFREVVPVHRLAYSFGWEGDEAVPPGSSLVEIDLIEQDDGTLLRIVKGPLTKQEKVRWDKNCVRIDRFNEDIELTTEALKDTAQIDREFFQYELAEFTRFRDLYIRIFGHYWARTRLAKRQSSVGI